MKFKKDPQIKHFNSISNIPRANSFFNKIEQYVKEDAKFTMQLYHWSEQQYIKKYLIK